MEQDRQITGGCHCGTVRYTLHAEPMMPGHCHCDNCKKLSGAGHASMFAVPQPAFETSGETTVYTHTADSGNVIHRHFCPTCAATVYVTNEGMAGLVMMPAGTLDDPESFQPQLVVYASRAPSWDVVDQALLSFAEMPPMDAMKFD